MKKIIGIVIILAVLALGSYYGMGLITERTLKKNFEMVNQNNGVSVTIERYNRGWFQSAALLNWRFHVPAHTINQNGQSIVLPAKDYQAQMPLTIYHGPIIYADSRVLFGFGYARTHLELPEQYVAQFNTVYTPNSVKPSLNLGVFVNYLNKTYLHADLPKFKLIAKQGNNQFEWLGMTSDLRISPKMNQVEGSVEIEGINYVKEQLQATLGSIKSDYDLHRTINGLYLGDANLALPSVIVLNAKQKVFEMDAFEVHSQSNIDEGLFSSTLKLALDKMFTQGKFYGPALLSMSIKNLDAQVLAEMNTQITQIQQNPDPDRQRALLSLLPQLPKLLNKGAEFEVSEFSMTVPEGVVKGNLLIALPKGELSNPFQLIQKIKGNGHVEVAAELLKNVIKVESVKKLQAQFAATQAMSPDEQIAVSQASAPIALSSVDIEQQAVKLTNEKILALKNAGALIDKGDHYIIDLKLGNGQMTVNGKPLSSSMMQF